MCLNMTFQKQCTILNTRLTVKNQDTYNGHLQTTRQIECPIVVSISTQWTTFAIFIAHHNKLKYIKIERMQH
jgi:hypothetical protein